MNNFTRLDLLALGVKLTVWPYSPRKGPFLHINFEDHLKEKELVQFTENALVYYILFSIVGGKTTVTDGEAALASGEAASV